MGIFRNITFMENNKKYDIIDVSDFIVEDKLSNRCVESDMKTAKFEAVIEDIQNKISARVDIWSPATTQVKIIKSYAPHQEVDINKALRLIYDYEGLNNYGKIIMEQSYIFLYKDDKYTGWAYQSKINTEKEKIVAAKAFINLCRQHEDKNEAYKFIFWALMVLTVDKTDAEEHLSLICDFAKMLKVTDDEMLDIVQVIKVIYQEEEESFKFKTETIPSCFAGIWDV